MEFNLKTNDQHDGCIIIYNRAWMDVNQIMSNKLRGLTCAYVRALLHSVKFVYVMYTAHFNMCVCVSYTAHIITRTHCVYSASICLFVFEFQFEFECIEAFVTKLITHIEYNYDQEAQNIWNGARIISWKSTCQEKTSYLSYVTGRNDINTIMRRHQSFFPSSSQYKLHIFLGQFDLICLPIELGKMTGHPLHHFQFMSQCHIKSIKTEKRNR